MNRYFSKEDIQMTDTWKDAPHRLSSGKCKSKPQWGITSYLSKPVNNTRNSKCWQGYGEISVHVFCPFLNGLFVFFGVVCLFFLTILFVSNLYTHWDTRTYNPKVKSHTLYRLNQPGTLSCMFFIYFGFQPFIGYVICKYLLLFSRLSFSFVGCFFCYAELFSLM